jgi:CO/xanthine dehydrogenase FAD-binding subunit
MALPRFSYLMPKNLQEACHMLAEHGDKAHIFAGGTDLLIKMQHGTLRPEYIIGISNIPHTDYIKLENEQLMIGANVKLAAVGQHLDIQHYFPALAYAVSVTASVQIRNMGTVVGNVCNASPSAETPTPLLVYDAKVVIMGPTGERILPINEFFQGPGVTALESGEVVKELVLPLPAERSGSNYQKLSARSKVDIAAVGVSVFLQLDESEVVSKARIAIGAVAPTPRRIQSAEKSLEGKEISQALIERAAQITRSEAAPITDLRASAAYRENMVEVLTQRAIHKSMDQIRKQ